MILDIWMYALMLVIAMGVMTWLYSLVIQDVSIVDSLWSLMFLAATFLYFMFASDMSSRAMLVLALVSIWSIRLSVFLTVRNWSDEEDRRYREIRANNQPFWIKSLYIVFLLQATLAWFISAPLLVAMQGATIGVIEYIAVALWCTGFLFEAVSDQQLYNFKKQQQNAGKVLNSGLWHYSRHPNYFGEFLVWWAYYLFAVQYGPWWIIAAPLLMTVLLLKVSGVSLMEKDISGRRPGYAAYIRNTNAFIPWFPRKDNAVDFNQEQVSRS